MLTQFCFVAGDSDTDASQFVFPVAKWFNLNSRDLGFSACPPDLLEVIRDTIHQECHAHEASVSASNTRRGNVQAIGYHPKNNYTEVEIAPKPAIKRRLNSSEKESQVTVPSLSSGSAYLQNVENIDPLKLWEHLSDSSLTDVITNVKSAEATYQLLVERKKQSFPITAKLDQLQTLPNFFILNPRLLGYQRTAVEKLWTGLTQGVSKILALEMGLGKTFVILELLMQSIAKGTEGAHLIFVPKSTLYQMQQEAICFQAEIKYQSLKKLLNLPEGQAFIIEHQEELVLNIKGQFPTSKILKEALTHQGKRGCIQEKMKGALRLLALLKKSPFKLALTMDLCDQERSWIKDLLAEYWENFLNSLTTHSSLKEFLKALDQPIKGISILNAETGLIDLNQVFKLNDQDFCIVAGILFNLHSDLDQSPGEISLEALQRLLMAPSIGEKSKNGIYICKDSEIDKLERFPLAFVAVDEAHRFNHSENKTSQKLENFIRAAKYKVLVTGTPLGNDYKELMALIRMANEGAFNSEAIEALNQLFDRYVRTIANPDSTFEEQAHFLIQSLSHFYELNKILEKMVIFLNKENPEVSENWQNRIPTLQHIYQTIQVKDPKRYQEVTDLFIQNKLKQPGFEKRIKKALIHPKVQNLKGDQLYQEALPYFKNEPIEKWIQNSDMFRNFYKDSQTGQFNNAYLQECVEKKSKGIVFVDLILAAEVCEIVLEDSQAVEVLVFTGEMDEKKRSEVISQFKANPSTDKAQILIMMIQAGGVGLNLACAEYVFLACETYSLIEKLQAIKRVDRVGNVGLKYILHLAYNIFLSQHIQVINQKKNEWIHFILQNEELTPRFHRWLKIGELTAKQAVLNKTKNQKDAESAFNVIEAKIALLKTYYTKQILHEEFHKQQITYNDQLDDQEVDLEIDQFMREVLNEESENSLSEIDWIDEIDQCLMQIDQEANLD